MVSARRSPPSVSRPARPAWPAPTADKAGNQHLHPSDVDLFRSVKGVVLQVLASKPKRGRGRRGAGSQTRRAAYWTQEKQRRCDQRHADGLHRVVLSHEHRRASSDSPREPDASSASSASPQQDALYSDSAHNARSELLALSNARWVALACSFRDWRVSRASVAAGSFFVAMDAHAPCFQPVSARTRSSDRPPAQSLPTFLWCYVPALFSLELAWEAC
jgi:hypothetical protein